MPEEKGKSVISELMYKFRKKKVILKGLGSHFKEKDTPRGVYLSLFLIIP